MELENFIKKNKFEELISFEIEDKFFEKKIRTLCKKNKIKLIFIK